MYFLTTSSFTCPTVSAKYPAAQKLSPREISKDKSFLFLRRGEFPLPAPNLPS